MKTFTVSTRFIQSIIKLSNSISKDDIRPYLCGVFWNSLDRELVATDGHVLTKHSYPEINIDEDVFFNFKKKEQKETIKLLKTMLKERKNQADIDFIIMQDKGIILDFGHANKVILSRAFFEYPNYKMIIPKTNSHKIEVSFDAAKLLQIIESLHFEISNKNKGIITMKITNEFSPIVITQTDSNKDGSIALLMPVKE